MNPMMDVAAGMTQATIPLVELKPQNTSRIEQGKIEKPEGAFAKVMAETTERSPKASDPEELSDEKKVMPSAGAVVNPMLAGLIPFLTPLITTEPVIAATVSAANSIVAATTGTEPVKTTTGIATPTVSNTMLPISAAMTPSVPALIPAGSNELNPTVVSLVSSETLKVKPAEMNIPLSDKTQPRITVPNTDAQNTVVIPNNVTAAKPTDNTQVQAVLPNTDTQNTVVIPNNVTAAKPTDTSALPATPTPTAASPVESNPQILKAVEVVSMKLPMENKPTDTVLLEVAPGIERLRIQPPEAALSKNGEQGFAEKGGQSLMEKPLPSLQTEDTVPAFALPSTDAVTSGYRPETIADTTTPAPAPQDPHSVFRQVLDAMPTSQDRLKSSEIIITLKPEHLGEVTVKISVDGNRVAAIFHSSNPEVRAILESSLPQLRQEMSQQGWNFDHGGVYDEMQGFLNQQNQQSQDRQPELPMQKRNRADYETAEIVPMIGQRGGSLSTTMSIDYRV